LQNSKPSPGWESPKKTITIGEKDGTTAIFSGNIALGNYNASNYKNPYSNLGDFTVDSGV
jgi:hypothetical protein